MAVPWIAVRGQATKTIDTAKKWEGERAVRGDHKERDKGLSSLMASD